MGASALSGVSLRVSFDLLRFNGSLGIAKRELLLLFSFTELLELKVEKKKKKRKKKVLNSLIIHSISLLN